MLPFGPENIIDSHIEVLVVVRSSRSSDDSTGKEKIFFYFRRDSNSGLVNEVSIA